MNSQGEANAIKAINIESCFRMRKLGSQNIMKDLRACYPQEGMIELGEFWHSSPVCGPRSYKYVISGKVYTDKKTR